MSGDAKTIVPGLTVDDSGTASVDPQLGKVLVDVAIEMEQVAGNPVDVEHVLAAIILAAKAGRLDAHARLSGEDPELVLILREYVASVFAQYGGRLGADD